MNNAAATNLHQILESAAMKRMCSMAYHSRSRNALNSIDQPRKQVNLSDLSNDAAKPSQKSRSHPEIARQIGTAIA